MRRILESLKVVGFGLVGIFVVGFGISTTSGMPSNARVFIDPEAGTYTAPPCVQLSEDKQERILQQLAQAQSYPDSIAAFVRVAGLVPAVSAEVSRVDLEPDPDCRESGAFFDDGRSLSGVFLQWAGVLRPLPSRWNEDGSWNW